uniref:Coiled-coil domain-containing protein 28B n=1 Tax=Arion vulgaris TaxID=1028688 RepID=A0A0B6YZ09_9EUPU
MESERKDNITTASSQSRRKSSQKEKTQSGRKISVSRPAKEHTFLTDVADVRTMEHGLIQLLDDFHSGKLQAFGNTATFNKMDDIRVQQEQLARQHFEMDLIPRPNTNRLSTEESRKENNDKIDKLIEQLHSLSVSVQTLQAEMSRQDIQENDE